MFTGIFLNTGTSGITTVNGNTIASMNMLGVAASGFYGIHVAGGKVQVGDSTSGASNTITGNTVSGTGLNAGIYATGGTDLSIGFNNITSNTSSGDGNQYGIFLSGISGNNVISNNTINTLINTGISSTLAGIHCNDGSNILITDNAVAALSNNGSEACSLYGISNSGGTNITLKNNQIYSNRLAGTTGNQAGIFNSAATNLDIEFNTIYDLGNSGTGTLAGIHLSAGSIPFVSSNSIYSITSSGSGGIGTLAGIYLTNVSDPDVEKNSISGVTNSNATSSGNTAAISLKSSGTNGTIRNNLISSIIQDGAGSLAGIIAVPTATGTILDISNNGIYSLSRTNPAAGSASQVTGIAVEAGTGINAANIHGNAIKTLVNANSLSGEGNLSSVCGIYNYTTASSAQLIENNTISELQNTYVGPNTINLTGIAIQGPDQNLAPSYNVISGNNIYLDGNCINGATLNAANLIGIDIQGAAYDLVNNMILLGYDNSGFTNDKPYVISGIKKSTSSTFVNNIYFNSISILGSSNTPIAGLSSACYNAKDGANTADKIQNNLFSNKRSNTGTSGTHYALYFNTFNTFDYNDYYSSGTGGLLSNGNNTVPLKSGEDASSLNVDPFFRYSKSITPGLGNLFTRNTCALGGKGISLASNLPAYIKDGFGVTQRATPPNIGAEEFAAPYTSAAASVSPVQSFINKCNPVPVQLYAESSFCDSVTYSWSPADGLSATDIANPMANPIVNTTYTVTISDGSTAVTATTLVNVDPSISIGAASICAGSSIGELPFDGVTGNPDKYRITWDATALTAGFINFSDSTLPDPNVDFQLNFPVPAGLTAGSSFNGIISVKNEVAGCESIGYPFSIQVVNGSPPNVDIPFIQSPYPAHVGDNVSLTLQTPSTVTYWEWLPIDILGFSGYVTSTNTLRDIPNPALNPITYDGANIRGPGNIWWINFAGNACGIGGDWGGLKYSKVVPVSIHRNPSSCNESDGSIGFPGLIPTGSYDIKFKKDGVVQTPISGQLADATGTLSISGLSQGMYSDIILFANTGYGVDSAPADSILLSGPAPTPSLTGVVTACANSQGNIYLTDSSATNYVWTISGGTITSGGGSTDNTATVTWNSAGAGSIGVTYFKICQVISPTLLTVSIETCGIPPTITLGTNPQVCFSDSSQSADLTYSAATDSPDEYQITWNTAALANGFQNVVYAPANLITNQISIAVPAGTPVNTYSGTLTIKNSTTGLESSEYPVSVTVNAIPTPTFTSFPNEICLDSAGYVYATQAGKNNYNWSVGGGTITSGGGLNDNTATITWTSQDTRFIAVQYENAVGCSNSSDSITVEKKPAPVGSFSYVATSNYVVQFSNQSSNGIGYLWLFEDGSTSSASNPTYTFPFEGSYPVSLVVNYSIYNTLGQMVLSEALNGVENQVIPINLSSLPSGVYFIQLGVDQLRHNRKIIKAN
jgi:hypothetical protein